MATSTTFVGQNSRPLAQFLNEQNSDINFVKNPKNGKIFAVLTHTGEAVTVSENAQTEIETSGLGTLADYQVCDMPSKDPITGMPDGKCFFLITRRGQNNVIGSLTR